MLVHRVTVKVKAETHHAGKPVNSDKSDRSVSSEDPEGSSRLCSLPPMEAGAHASE